MIKSNKKNVILFKIPAMLGALKKNTAKPFINKGLKYINNYILL